MYIRISYLIYKPRIRQFSLRHITFPKHISNQFCRSATPGRPLYCFFAHFNIKLHLMLCLTTPYRRHIHVRRCCPWSRLGRSTIPPSRSLVRRTTLRKRSRRLSDVWPKAGHRSWNGRRTSSQNTGECDA